MIEDLVNSKQLKPSDYTIKLYGIPTNAKSEEIRDSLTFLFHGKTVTSNVHVVKHFSNWLQVFENLNEKGKVLRDLRTRKFRKQLAANPLLSQQEVMKQVME